MTEHVLPARTTPADPSDPAIVAAVARMARRRPLAPDEEVVAQTAEWVELASFVEDLDGEPIGLNVVRAPLIFRHVRRRTGHT
jgi:hypothetical protein